MAKDIFQSYREEDYPPYDEEVMIEADGNLELADLIERREILIDEMGLRKGPTGIVPREGDPTLLYAQSLYDQILAKKRALGIEPPQE